MTKLIAFLLLAFIVYNVTVIILFNRYVREYMNPDIQNAISYDELLEKYDELNPVLQYLSRFSDIENGMINKVTNTHVNANGDAQVTIFTQSGSYTGTYIGELTDSDVPHGAGKVVFINKDGVECTYEGEFEDGRLSGYGVLNFATGDVMRGIFADGMLNGYGEIYLPNKILLSRGAFINNKLNGNGILYDKNGNTIFNGAFEYGIPIKADYIPLCQTPDYNSFKSNPRSFIGKNISLVGVLNDVHIDEAGKQFYLFTPNNDPAASFMVYCDNPDMTFELSHPYKVYGYCIDYGMITSSHSVTNQGLKLNGYHFEIQ